MQMKVKREGPACSTGRCGGLVPIGTHMLSLMEALQSNIFSSQYRMPSLYASDQVPKTFPNSTRRCFCFHVNFGPGRRTLLMNPEAWRSRATVASEDLMRYLSHKPLQMVDRLWYGNDFTISLPDFMQRSVFIYPQQAVNSLRPASGPENDCMCIWESRKQPQTASRLLPGRNPAHFVR